MKRSRKTIIRSLDKYFSLYIRKRDERFGCITCGVKIPYKNAHAGHFVKRGNWSVRYDEKNVNLQCPRCNLFLNGDDGMYAIALDKKYGQGTAEKLLAERGKVKKFKIWELEELEQKYKAAAK